MVHCLIKYALICIKLQNRNLNSLVQNFILLALKVFTNIYIVLEDTVNSHKKKFTIFLGNIILYKSGELYMKKPCCKNLQNIKFGVCKAAEEEISDSNFKDMYYN